MAHKARKRFGQNFLHDQHIIDNILGSLFYSKDQHWVEIGPGQGALTEPLLSSGVQLDVVELDRDLVRLLGYKFKQYDNLTIHSSDALKFDFSSLAQDVEKLHILGNLPYNISTPLMFHLLENTPRIADMTFMLQKEVVDRICAGPGSKKYGRLSIMMQYYCATEHLFDVPPESFNPTPKVMSSIVRLEPHAQPPVIVDSVKMLNTVVTTAFSQRRKTLRNSLKKLITETDIIALDISPTLRAETISLQDFAKLSQYIKQHPPEETL
ncbi:16S rRNA (adenine(1518)-N(6)/adenine(1519)-N(6))-dimethyltransferase [Methylococcaceae bacterium CS1]|nr:16S rRNA (adenine(1518)-N(6)/adenine(1519)-N(6))-dimethyltransferase [Methylococcaceae bacterium CS4]TXL00062.1 16S rRNA (adenine(1518)-N(6)/adenine(1519)-N(6))-dimethyltransferase [Methylococcaceae bacterium CS5]TXL06063.1 16S rRNA (adenine(1518)-N(6)/adenine(1519)-N(6))-dimethyltransferase [Methylococcaceae bacterium CS1]TXL06723.1 16S rRNA (adenine(1518)-N(6)/adenine(1519)-N(6))-dimethyltransferase [Methylococcaceae bacterium CS3]TXL10489.1 16S rRNA (adenine(1518)-N(6)/adenine(1519)-N(6))